MITQFLGHIVRGEPIQLVDGGSQQRAFTYIDDGIAAWSRSSTTKAASPTGRSTTSATRPTTTRSAQLAEMMLALARTLPEYAERGRGACG